VVGSWLEETNNALQQDPENPGLLADAGYALTLSGDLQVAYDKLSAAIRLKPDNHRAHFNLGLLYLEKEVPLKAYSEIRTAVQLAPKTLIYKEKLKEVAAMVGKTDEAMTLLSSAENIAPGAEVPGVVSSNEKEEKEFQAGLEAVKKGDPIAAAKHFEAVLQMNPQNKDAAEKLASVKAGMKSKNEVSDLVMKGSDYVKAKEWKDALEILEKARDMIGEKPETDALNYQEVRKLLAQVYVNTGKFDKAIDIFRDMAKQNPKYYLAYYNMGAAYEAKAAKDSEAGDARAEEDSKTRALAAYQKALEIGEIVDDSQTYSNARSAVRRLSAKVDYTLYIAIVLILAGLAGSVTVYNLPAVKTKRLLKQSDNLRAQGNWVKLVPVYSRLLGQRLSQSDNAKISQGLAQAYLNTDKVDDAIKMAKKVVALDRAGSLGHEILARAYFKKKTVTDEAIKEYKHLLEAEPNNFELIKLVGQYYIKAARSGSGYKRGGEAVTDDMVNAFKRYIHKDPTNEELVLFLAEVLRKRKDSSGESIPIYERALKVNPEDSKTRAVLAKAYFDAKQFEKAINLCHQLFTEDLNNTQTHRIFIDSHIALQRYGQVTIEYEKLSLQHPSNEDIARRLVELKRQNISVAGDRPDGAAAQGSALAAAPTIDYVACLEKGREAYKKGDMNKAIGELKVALKNLKEPRQQYECQFLLIWSYMKKGLLDMALETLKGTKFDTELMPAELKDLIYKLGGAMEEKGRFNEALEMYNILCKVDIGYKDVFDKFEELHQYVAKF
jgi:tetratricopeptide (TPR) repeat protein